MRCRIFVGLKSQLIVPLLAICLLIYLFWTGPPGSLSLPTIAAALSVPCVGIAFALSLNSLRPVHSSRDEDLLRAKEAELKRVKDELFLAHQSMRTILNTLPVAVIMVDRSGTIVLSNPAAERLFLKPVLTGKNYAAVARSFLLAPEGNSMDPQSMVLMRAMAEARTFTNFELTICQPGGQKASVLLNAAPVYDERGNIIGAAAVFQDISEQKRGEQQARLLVDIGEQLASQQGFITQMKQVGAMLEKTNTLLARSNKDLEQLAFVVSHDLQEPQRKVQAFGERLVERLQGKLEPEETDYLRRMLEASRRMQNLINDLLSYSRIATRSQPFVRVDLEEVASAVIVDLELRIEHSCGQVEVGALPEVEADPTQMHQLLQNLISNALKFQRKDAPPRIRLSSRQVSASQVQIEVEDNGIGFRMEELERIFQPFQRLHNRSIYEDNGIGLAICQRIVSRHGGTITAASTLGQGTTFLITLPARQH